MTKTLSTQKFHNLNTDEDLRNIMGLTILIVVFIWYNRYTFLTLAENINKLFRVFAAIAMVWYSVQYRISWLFNPFPYGPG